MRISNFSTLKKKESGILDHMWGINLSLIPKDGCLSFFFLVSTLDLEMSSLCNCVLEFFFVHEYNLYGK